MNHELMITRYREQLYSCYYEEGKLVELYRLSDTDNTVRLGNIYVGRIQNVVKNLNAVFVEVQPGVVCYYPLSEQPPRFLNHKQGNTPAIGDELLVQVTKEAMKTKAPTVDCTIQLTGNLAVVTLDSAKVMVSKKLPRDEKVAAIKEHLEALVPDGYSVIVRTNAYEQSLEAITSEVTGLIRQLQTILSHAACHKVYSCLYQERSSLIQLMDDYQNSSLTRIVTDVPDIYEELCEHLHPEEQDKLVCYEPKQQPLYAIYRLDRDIKELSGTKLWLKSGAYLVIEQTEAMVVIDVNTGKAVNRKEKQQHLLNVNIEAATEIARQLRLRNLSGIIVIDFIDMEPEEYKQCLIEHLCRELKRDRVPTRFIDMTGLNLVELTRKKVRKPLKV